MTQYSIEDLLEDQIVSRLKYLQLMSIWSGSTYAGEYKEGWYHGKGRLEYSNGVVYEGDFLKGQYDGQGVLIYPNGGRYQATWKDGKMVEGEYFFDDKLKYQFQEWKHCTGQDRRFYQQSLNGIRPAGATQTTREDFPHSIPQGTYDVGQGYYEPIKSTIYKYNGQILRTPQEIEVQRIVSECRYNPRTLEISGKDDKMIKRIIEKNMQVENTKSE